MFRALLILVILLVVSCLAEPARAQGSVYAAIVTPAPTKGQQPETVTQTPPAEAGLAGEAMGMISRIASGEKKLTVDEILNPEFWRGIVTEVALAAFGFIPRIVVGVVCLAVFYGIYRMVRRVALGSMSRARVDPSIKEMLSSMIKWTIMGFGIVIACNQVGVQITALLTGVSIIGLSVGFAAQTTLANFIAGIVIFWDKPFKIGDWVEIDGVFAQVRRVTFRSTRLLNKDGEVVVLPNTAMLNTRLLNHTTEPVNRVAVPIRISWSDSIDTTRAMLLELLRGDARVCTRPAPTVDVDALEDSAVRLVLHFWVSDESIVYDIRSEYLERAKKSLDALKANSTEPRPLTISSAA
jgi:small conductance mechanosensitive channel